MVEYRRLEDTLDGYNLVVIYGATGTGKTGFINNYFNKIKNCSINHINSFTSLKTIRTMIKNKEYFSDKKVIIYDDTKIKKELIDYAEKYIHPKKGNVRFIVIVNQFLMKPKEFIVHKIEYPNKNVLLLYFNKIKLSNAKLRSELLNLEPKSLRRIEMSIEDGYISDEQDKENKRFHVFNHGTFVLSTALAENIGHLKRFNELLCEADKYKKNELLYKDFVKLYYPSLDRMRLRYPKELLELIKNRREKR